MPSDLTDRHQHAVTTEATTLSACKATGSIPLQRACESTGLAPLQAVVILQMADGAGSLACQDLREAVGLSPTEASRVINSLEEARLLERVTPQTDRRLVMIELTESGWEAVEGIDALLGGKPAREKAVHVMIANRAAMEKFRVANSLSRCQAACLVALVEAGVVLPATGIASSTGLKRTTVLAALDKLCEKGFATVNRSARATCYVATEQGAACVADVARVGRAACADHAAGADYAAGAASTRNHRFSTFSECRSRS